MFGNPPFDLVTLCAVGAGVGLLGVLGLYIDARLQNRRRIIRDRIDELNTPPPLPPPRSAGTDKYTKFGDLLIKHPPEKP